MEIIFVALEEVEEEMLSRKIRKGGENLYLFSPSRLRKHKYYLAASVHIPTSSSNFPTETKPAINSEARKLGSQMPSLPYMLPHLCQFRSSKSKNCLWKHAESGVTI
jgi:hypothetical protein